MNARKFIQQSLSNAVAFDGAKIFPSLLIDPPYNGRMPLCAADQALEYYRSRGFFGARSTRNADGYGGIISSLNSAPPWVEAITMEEIDEISKERDIQLRPLVRYAQEESEELLLEQFRQYLSEQDKKFNLLWARRGGSVIDASLSKNYRMNELENFKSLIALARQLGPDLACDLAQILLYEFGDDSDGILVGAGAPDLLLWTRGGENEFWFFSEVKAPGDSLRATQKAWLTNHWGVIQGHFLLTIIS